jgi:hypothetical protein
MEHSGETRIRVRISPEDAGGIGASPVIAQEIPLRTLVDWVVRVTGKDAARIEGILARGSFVKSLSRIRWEPFSAGDALREILAGFPDDWPERPFRLDDIREVVVTAGVRKYVIAGKVARQRRWFRGQSFLQCCVDEPSLPNPAYQRYDFEERADRFCIAIPPAALAAFWRALDFLPNRQLRTALHRCEAKELVLLLPRKE